MDDRDLEARLRSTYRAEAERADPGALAERVHSIPATVVPERRRWWHGFGFGVARRVGPRGEQLLGGINMLVSIRMAAVVAVLALATSLVAVRVGSPDESVTPGAAGPAGNWVTVTGTQEMQVSSAGHGSGTRTMSDPRVDGDVAITWLAVMEPGNPEYDNYPLWGTTTITNDGGTWQGQWVGFRDDGGLHHVMEWFEGTGDYEGLRYIEQSVEREPGSSTGEQFLDATGLIYEGMAPQTVIPAELADAVQ
jgi:hypothetical protein